MVRGLRYENNRQIPFQMPAYTFYDPPVSLQRLVNIFPDRLAAQDQERFTLRKFQGYEFWLGFNEGAILATHVFKGVLYVATGTALLKVQTDKSFVKIGTFGGADEIQILNTANLLVLRVDSALYTHTTNDVDSPVLVTDPDLQPSDDITIINNYVFSVVQGQNGQFQWSDFNDPDDFSALNFATAEYRADRLNAVVSLRNEFLLFGDATVEFWAVVGGSNVVSPRNYASNIGCITKESIVIIKDVLFFIGVDPANNETSIYRLQGYNPVSIASRHIKDKISGLDLTDAYGFSHHEQGYDFYTIVIPDQTAFTYCIELDSWVERRSWNALNGTFKADTNVKDTIRFNNQTLVCARDQVSLFKIGGDGEADDRFPWEVVLPFNSVKPYKRMISSVKLDVLNGSGEIGMSFTRDEGRSWSAEDWRSVTDTGQQTQDIYWHRLGYFDRMALRFRGENQTTIIGGCIGT